MCESCHYMHGVMIGFILGVVVTALAVALMLGGRR